MVPLHFVTLMTVVRAMDYYRQLKDSHRRTYNCLMAHAILSLVMLIVAIQGLASYLDSPMKERHHLFLRLSPLLVVLLSFFGIFLYLLPGLCDPESQTDRRIPFQAFLYFLSSFMTISIMCVNAQLLPQMNAYLIFFPFIAA